MGFIIDKIDEFQYNRKLHARPDEDERAIKKGKDFEEFVGSTLFPDDFDVSNRAADVFQTKIRGSYLNAKYPFDFEITHKKTHEVFAIECKWRSGVYFIEKYHTDALYVTKDKEQLEKYKRVARELNVPAFIVAGLEGTPEKPKYLFCFPLDELKYPTVFVDVCERYRRPVDKLLTWKYGKLF